MESILILQPKINSIKNIIKNVVFKMIRTNICEDDIKNAFIIDIKKMYNYKKDFRIKINDDEYINYDKREYVLNLFRVIEILIPTFSINNLLFDMYINNKYDKYNLLSKNNKYINPKNCNITLNIERKLNGEYILGIYIAKEYNDEFINKYKKYLSELKINDENIDTYIEELSKNNKIVELVKNYSDVFYSLNISISDKDKNKDTMYAILLFLQFVLINCEYNYIFCNLDLISYEIKNDNGKGITFRNNHRNKLIFKKNYDFKKDLSSFNVIHYEPQGKVYGPSFNEIDIEYFFKLLNQKINNIDKKNDKLLKYKLYTKNISCEIGPQTLSYGEDIGFCTIFSAFWYDILLKVITIIEANDNIPENKNDDKLLSTLPIEMWIEYIDYYITEIINMKIDYNDKKIYNIDNIMNIVSSMFKENKEKFEKLIEKINVKTGKNLNIASDEAEIFNNIKDLLIGFNKGSNMMSFRQFMIFYTNLLNLDINSFYKMKKISYFSIFVNYAHSLFELIYKNKYFSEEELAKFNKFLVNPNYIDMLKLTNEFKGEIKKFEQDDIIHLDENDKKELEEREEKYSKGINKEVGLHEIFGKEEFEKIMNELTEETNSFNNIYCKNDSKCKEKNSNLYCEDNYCNHKKLEIGEKCNDNQDCYSNFCKESKNKITNETVRYCRKKI